jgi:hypothetical protein
MARYEVTIDVAHGPRVARKVRAQCAEAAYQSVRSGLIEAGVEPGERDLSTVWRLGLLGPLPVPLGTWDLGGDDDGTAGVREPPQAQARPAEPAHGADRAARRAPVS